MYVYTIYALHEFICNIGNSHRDIQTLDAYVSPAIGIKFAHPRWCNQLYKFSIFRMRRFARWVLLFRSYIPSWRVGLRKTI